MSRCRKSHAPHLSAAQIWSHSSLDDSVALIVGNMRTCMATSPKLVSSRWNARCNWQATRAPHFWSAASSHSLEQ